MTIPNELLDSLMKDYKSPEDLIGETGLLKQLTKQLLERAMTAEMTEHLGYEKNAPTGKKTSNSRNGSYPKRIKGEFGNLDIAVPVTVIPVSNLSLSLKGRAVSLVSITKSSPFIRPLKN